ncbi:MAG: beta-lactamase family protein [Tannerella sp.]|jgi:CubicO group peptidase (beta-lactamase class C family)|nr:beta-lactamase family protein [Tannerella sp.]
MENIKSDRRTFIKSSALGALGMISVPSFLTGCAVPESKTGSFSDTFVQEDAKGLVFATPESRGVPTGAILDMLDTLEAKRVCLHSFILLRNGAVVAEGYWPPFHKDKFQRMYSVSKSFTSVAIGLMITEGKLKLEDKIADIFPEDIPANPHPFVLQATVRDLLMMSTFNPRSVPMQPGRTSVWSFLNSGETLRPPGAIFAYDTQGTNTLAAIIEKKEGIPFLEYMRSKILDPIGFSKDAYCIQNTDGRSWSGSGVLCTSRDLARFALLCMNMGAFEGTRLVSKAYMQAATSRQIDNTLGKNEAEMKYGYGYQFWCLRDGGFAGYGMGGQYCLCMPKYDTILVTTGDAQLDSEGLGEILGAYMVLLKRVGSKMADDRVAQKQLSSKIESLAFRLPDGQLQSPAAVRYNDKVFKMENNPMKWSGFRLSFTPGEATLHYTNANGNFSLRIGLGNYLPQSFPEPYSGKVSGIHDTYYDILVAGAWTSENVFTCAIKAVDHYLGTIRMQFAFQNDTVCVQMVKQAEMFWDNYQGVGWGRG